MHFADSAVLFDGEAAVATQGSNSQFCVTDCLFTVKPQLKLVYCLYDVHAVNTAAARFDCRPVLVGLCWQSGIISENFCLVAVSCRRRLTLICILTTLVTGRTNESSNKKWVFEYRRSTWQKKYIETEAFAFLGCYVASFSIYVSTFRKALAVPSSSVNHIPRRRSEISHTFALLIFRALMYSCIRSSWAFTRSAAECNYQPTTCNVWNLQLLKKV